MEQMLWFGWFRADIIAEYAPLFWHGLQMTILVTVICIVQGTLLGLALGMARLAEARHAPARQICRYLLRWPATVYVSFFRGTPLFVQLLLMHFAVLPLFINPADGLLVSGEAARNLKQNYGAFLSGVAALTLNAGAYISEVFRAGIQSIDRGQVEAARSLGLSYGRTMIHVVLPQAFRRMLPPLGVFQEKDWPAVFECIERGLARAAGPARRRCSGSCSGTIAALRAGRRGPPTTGRRAGLAQRRAARAKCVCSDPWPRAWTTSTAILISWSTCRPEHRCSRSWACSRR